MNTAREKEVLRTQPACLIQALTASRVACVISNCTGLERRFLADDLAFVPWLAACDGLGVLHDGLPSVQGTSTYAGRECPVHAFSSVQMTRTSRPLGVVGCRMSVRPKAMGWTPPPVTASTCQSGSVTNH